MASYTPATLQDHDANGHKTVTKSSHNMLHGSGDTEFDMPTPSLLRCVFDLHYVHIVNPFDFAVDWDSKTNVIFSKLLFFVGCIVLWTPIFFSEQNTLEGIPFENVWVWIYVHIVNHWIHPCVIMKCLMKVIFVSFCSSILFYQIWLTSLELFVVSLVR